MRHIVIGLCTAQRPQMLRDCLTSLAALEAPPGARVTVAVVENMAEPACRPVVEAVAAVSPHPILYGNEPRRGIPQARNASLRMALAAGADLVALLDDDERAAPDWLVRLDRAMSAHGAEVANGPVRRIYEKPAPRWWKSQLLKPRPTGTPINEAPTNNVMFSARLVRPRPEGLGLAFDERLTYGSEDMDFFRRAHRAGVRMIWVEDAWVEEFIPASRVAPARLLSRLHMAAASGTYNMVLTDGRARAAVKFVPKSVRRLVLGALALPAGLVLWPVMPRRGERVFFYGVTRISKAAGNLRGLTGRAHRYYDLIDGR